MTDRALRYFLAVVRASSIRGAAALLNVAASAVSRQVAELEAEVGEPLLERLPRGVVPTEAGRVLAAHAQRQADEAARLREELGRLRGIRSGTVGLVCGDGFMADLFAHGLAALVAAHPDLAFEVATGTTDEILRAVAEGDADLGLAYNPPAHPGIRAVATARQPLAAIVAPDHPLARERKAVPLSRFADTPTVLLPRSHGIRQMIARAEAERGIRLRPALVTSAFDLHRRFAAAGLGAAFLPGFAAWPDIETGAVQAVRLADPLLSEATAHLVVRAGRRLPDAVECAIEALVGGLLSLRRGP